MGSGGRGRGVAAYLCTFLLSLTLFRELYPAPCARRTLRRRISMVRFHVTGAGWPWWFPFGVKDVKRE
jgi:hypothetical protein